MKSGNTDKKNWYALYTKSRAEKKVLKEFEYLGIEAYLPLRKTMKQWSDRKKKVEEPVIKSYIFVHIEENKRYDVFKADGVVNFVHFEGKPAVIRDQDIKAFQQLVDQNIDFEVTSEHLTKGQKVKITFGDLRNVEGEITEILGKKQIAIHIDQIGFSLIVKIPVQYTEVIE
jgi:transcription antitermination factor NusG